MAAQPSPFTVGSSGPSFQTLGGPSWLVDPSTNQVDSDAPLFGTKADGGGAAPPACVVSCCLVSHVVEAGSSRMIFSPAPYCRG